MQLTNLAFLSMLVASTAVSAQDINNNDVPSACRDVCGPVIQLSQRCDGGDDVDDDGEDGDGFISCVCNDSSASQIPLCEACVRSNNRNDGDDNDVNDFLTSCNLQSTTWTGAVASATGAPSAPNSAPAANPTNNNGNNNNNNNDDDDNDDDDDCFDDGEDRFVCTPGQTQVVQTTVNGTPTTTVVVVSQTPGGGNNAPTNAAGQSPSEGSAPAATAGVMGVMGAVLVGVAAAL